LNRAADILGDAVSQQWVRDCHFKKSFALHWFIRYLNLPFSEKPVCFRTDANEVLSKQYLLSHDSYFWMLLAYQGQFLI